MYRGRYRNGASGQRNIKKAGGGAPPGQNSWRHGCRQLRSTTSFLSTSTPPLLLLLLLQRPVRLFLPSFSYFFFLSGALSSCSAVVPPEGFKNNSVNCIPVRRETEKSGWKKTSDSRRSMVAVVVERGGRGGAVSIVVAAAWYRPGSFLPPE